MFLQRIYGRYSSLIGSHWYSTFPILNRSTIYSLSSGHGKCGVAVIRVSGPQTSEAVKKLSNKQKLPVPRKCHLMKFYHPVSFEAIDKGLLLWFPGPHSFTGEDCAEFQIHGGSAVIMAMHEALSTIPGLRTAEAGEFTKRAFMNNKLDLTEVEGLADLIHAETEIQRKQALRQMDGDLSKLYMTWRQILIKCTANIEAYIDFSEDENIEDDVVDSVNVEVEKISENIENHLKDNRRGERLRSGIQIAIIGEPNVGKSSLLNILCRRPAAIVSPIAGTTRDIIESGVNIGGYPVLLSDTAGLHHTQHDVIEIEGIRRAIKRAQEADIKVIVVDSTKITSELRNTHEFITEHLKHLGIIQSVDNLNNSALQNSDKQLHDTYLTQDLDETNSSLISAVDLSEVILVFNKIDMINNDMAIVKTGSTLDSCAKISCITEDGIEEFLDLLTDKIKNLCGNPIAGNPSLTQARHRTHLSNCLNHLKLYTSYIQLDDIVLAAHQLHLALREIGKITGKITSEDILDVVFKDFCIGK